MEARDGRGVQPPAGRSRSSRDAGRGRSSGRLGRARVARLARGRRAVAAGALAGRDPRGAAGSPPCDPGPTPRSHVAPRRARRSGARARGGDAAPRARGLRAPAALPRPIRPARVARAAGDPRSPRDARPRRAIRGSRGGAGRARPAGPLPREVPSARGVAPDRRGASLHARDAPRGVLDLDARAVTPHAPADPGPGVRAAAARRADRRPSARGGRGRPGAPRPDLDRRRIRLRARLRRPGAPGVDPLTRQRTAGAGRAGVGPDGGGSAGGGGGEGGGGAGCATGGDEGAGGTTTGAGSVPGVAPSGPGKSHWTTPPSGPLRVSRSQRTSFDIACGNTSLNIARLCGPKPRLTSPLKDLGFVVTRAPVESSRRYSSSVGRTKLFDCTVTSKTVSPAKYSGWRSSALTQSGSSLIHDASASTAVSGPWLRVNAARASS